jgi:hypothetical protein
LPEAGPDEDNGRVPDVEEELAGLRVEELSEYLERNTCRGLNTDSSGGLEEEEDELWLYDGMVEMGEES